jgi:hypothetical protein
VDPLPVDTFGSLGELTNAHDIQDSVLEATRGRFLEHQLGLAFLDEAAIDLRKLGRPDNSDASGPGSAVESRPREQTPKTGSVVGPQAELDDFSAATGQVRSRHDG